MEFDDFQRFPIGSRISIFTINKEHKTGTVYRYQLKGITLRKNGEFETVLWKDIIDYSILESKI